jgi:anti-sigma regulatory factor (Ser/Thr protein kinase)
MEEIRLPLSHDTPTSTARRVCEQALRDWDVSDRTDDVLLVTTELVQNMSQHTDDGGELHLSLHDDAIIVEVTDTNPDLPHLPPKDHTRPGGRGLLLVAAVTQRWGTRPAAWAGRRGKVIWARLVRRLSPDSRG